MGFPGISRASGGGGKTLKILNIYRTYVAYYGIHLYSKADDWGAHASPFDRYTYLCSMKTLGARG